jgi:endonuclease G, mitochondrial
MDEIIIETRELDATWYANSTGYDPCFLGPRIELPTLPAALREDLAPLIDSAGYELKYTHFSILVSKSRKLAVFTAVNIDGKNLQDLKRSRDVWYFDPRMDRKYQMGPEVYKHPDIDRGHLVRRLDPVWGTEAVTANEDTFHFTNCSPQHSKLNQITWLGLEEYIMDNAKVNDLKVTVYTGPVFRADDKVYLGKYLIPAEFWKVVVIVKTDGSLSATAYLESQRDLIANVKEFSYGEYKTYQLPVTEIQKLTDLKFGELAKHDPLSMIAAKDGGAVVMAIEGPQDLIL